MDHYQPGENSVLCYDLFNIFNIYLKTDAMLIQLEDSRKLREGGIAFDDKKVQNWMKSRAESRKMKLYKV